MNCPPGFNHYKWVKRTVQRIYQGLIVFSLALLSSCSTETTYAPVTDINAIEPIPKTGQHQVMTGETLYEIAWRYGLDYRAVAKQNQMQAPYKVNEGEAIQLKAKKPFVLSAAKPKPVIYPHAKEPQYRVNHWRKPAMGRMIQGYSVRNRGIDIAGHVGEAIYAAAPGKVVYSGDGLRGYGNLIIIKHNSLYLSAYAYNRVNLVKEGEWVKQGQKIAEMGIKSTGGPMLHFEIRKAGKPINPMLMIL